MVMDGWFGVVDRDVSWVVHGGGDVVVDGMVFSRCRWWGIYLLSW